MRNQDYMTSSEVREMAGISHTIMSQLLHNPEEGMPQPINPEQHVHLFKRKPMEAWIKEWLKKHPKPEITTGLDNAMAQAIIRRHRFGK